MTSDDRVYVGGTNNLPMEVVTMAHELNIGTIGGLSLQDIMKMNSASGANPVLPFPVLGSTLIIGSKQYIIYHINDKNVFAGLRYWEEDVSFYNSSDSAHGVESTIYRDSILANKCVDWFMNKVPSDLKNAGVFDYSYAGDENVVFPCFIPSVSQLTGNLSTYSGGKAENNDQFEWSQWRTSLIFYNSSGTAKAWWTATDWVPSGQTNSFVWVITEEGRNSTGSYSNITRGFRPFLALRRDAFEKADVAEPVFPTPVENTDIVIGNKTYMIYDVTDTDVKVTLKYWEEDICYNIKSDSTFDYAKSYLAARCSNWFNEMVPIELKHKNIFDLNHIAGVDESSLVSAEPVVGPCFACDMYDIDYDFRNFTDKSGTPKTYWIFDSTNVVSLTAGYYNDTTGLPTCTSNANETHGFRPCLAIRREAFAD